MRRNDRNDGHKARIERLEQERHAVLDDIRNIQEWLQIEVDTDLDEADPDLAEREKNLALLRAMEDKLQSLDKALRSIEKGQYGICERCGEPIDPARLEVLLDASLCLACQQQVERMTKRNMLR